MKTVNSNSLTNAVVHKASPARDSAGAHWMFKAVNFVSFQLCWVGCVWGAAAGAWWLGPVMVGLFAIWHLRQSSVVASDVRLIGMAVAGGFLVDSALALSGQVSYASPLPWAQLAPVWIIAMWVGFALTLNHSMDWLHGKPWLAGALGAVFGPLAYYVGGDVWGALTFEAPVAQALILIGLIWAVATPALLAATQPAHARTQSGRN